MKTTYSRERLILVFFLLAKLFLSQWIFNNYPPKSRGISPDRVSRQGLWPRLLNSGAKLKRYSARLSRTRLLSRIIISLFNTFITKHSFITEKLETIFILSFFSPTREITYSAEYLLTSDDEYSVHLIMTIE